MRRSPVDPGEADDQTICATRPAQELFDQLLESSLVLAEDWESLPAPARAAIRECSDFSALLSLLQEHALLTEYQADRIEAGTTHGLILGNYRVLARLGAGAMGVVFKAEHCRMRRQVAVKVLPVLAGQDQKLLLRFFTEMRAVAQLQHPNIVAAIDAGEIAGQDRDAPVLHYFVMEYVPGQNLEEHVKDQGPVPIAKACDLAYQVASALAEANKHKLVHRDIKPSNVLITPDSQAKLLDFGLARHFRHRHTEPGTLLGTLDYMAPEQAQDAGSVDIRADIYALGATLFFCLTAKPPFQTEGSLIQAVTQRLKQPAPSIRDSRPEVPVGLDAVLARMMALKPDDRYAAPEAVMQALLPFLRPELHEHSILSPLEPFSLQQASLMGLPSASHGHRLLIVDDRAGVREFCRCVLEAEGFQCAEAIDGEQGLELANAEPFDMVLLDIDMPKMQGPEVLRCLREHPPRPNLKVIMFSGRATPDEMAAMLVAGADGYLTKPFSSVQLGGQVKAALRLKNIQDRSDLLNRRLVSNNAELERTLGARDSDLVHARNALVLALATLVKHRDGETGAHVWRLQRYSRCLAENAASLPSLVDQIDASFIDLVECCAPLHDIGKVGIPDNILLKPGKLTHDERMQMQTHTIIGAETLKEVADHHGTAVAFLQMASDIARHHHEHYDGTGYPDRLAAGDIPLAARIVAIGDVYDALRSRRVYKPSLSHLATVQIMTEGSPGHFDPVLMQAFHRCEGTFDKIFQELAG
jgi:response regulator RpfG family c-di-GMP phosphodiesterase/serine/threonine protein kinase